MHLFTIVIDENIEDFQTRLNSQIQSLVDDGIGIEEKIEFDKPFYILKYGIDIEHLNDYPIVDIVNIFRYCIANTVFEYIKYYKEPQLINKILNYDYYYFDIDERSKIEERIDSYMKNESYVDILQNESQKRITKMFIDYLKNNSVININGFITFRLKEYVLGLQEIVDRAVESFLMDQEYNEFIKLLRYFVDIQEPKYEVLNILFEEDERYQLYDEFGNIINNEYLNIIEAELDASINHDDLLISSLITIAPNEIYIHKIDNLKNMDLIQTISKIFQDRIILCDNCQWCRIHTNIKKE